MPPKVCIRRERRWWGYPKYTITLVDLQYTSKLTNHQLLNLGFQFPVVGPPRVLCACGTIRFLKGYQWDGATMAWCNPPETLRASMVHDALGKYRCRAGSGSEFMDVCDHQFKQDLHADGASTWLVRRWMAALRFLPVRWWRRSC